MQDEISRREFVKRSVAGSAAIAAGSSALLASATPATPALDLDKRHQLVAALGDLFVPSAPGDPGYKDLEQYGITDYVLKNLKLSDDLVQAFIDGAKQLFAGKTFLELDGKQREQYLETIVDGDKIADEKQRTQLQTIFRASRARILTVYYTNYPENNVKRNDQGEAILKPGDKHQITNPNTKQVVTGWDVAGFKGPMEWEEEEQRRATMKKMLPSWFEGDLVRLTGPGK
jgi:hypothetical protein